MSVEEVLSKLCAHNDSILGAVVRSNDVDYHNLSGAYQIIDVENLADFAEQSLMLIGGLEVGEDEFSSLFLEYENHSLYIKKIELGVLLLLTEPIPRKSFKKVQIGINLFMKKLTSALENPMTVVEAPVQETEVEEKEEPPKKKSGFLYRGQSY